MKIIYQNSIDSLTTSVVPISSDYGISSALDDVPKHAFIPNQYTGSTVTCTLKTAAGSNEMSLFITYFAEAYQIVFKDISNSTISSTSGTNTAQYTADLENPYLLLDRTMWNNSIFLDIPQNTKTIQITFTNSTDFKDTITNWVSSQYLSRGKVTASGSDVLYEDNAQIRLGTIITDGSTNYQMTRLVGIGSGSRDIQVFPTSNSNFTITALYLPIYLNTIRAGKHVEIFNPSVGLSVEYESFGIVQSKDSNMNYSLGEIRRVFSGNLQILESERINLLKILNGLRNRPVAARILDYQNETAVFGSFLEMPGFTYSNQGSRIYDLSLTFTELI